MRRLEWNKIKRFILSDIIQSYAQSNEGELALDFIANDIIDDAEGYDDDNNDNDSEKESENKDENEFKSTKTKAAAKEDEKKFFWDKETNEDNAKKINEEDSYQWEEEVSSVLYCAVLYVTNHTAV